jgi:membrane protein implicated in regulation of membrane protease activity
VAGVLLAVSGLLQVIAGFSGSPTWFQIMMAVIYTLVTAGAGTWMAVSERPQKAKGPSLKAGGAHKEFVVASSLWPA